MKKNEPSGIFGWFGDMKSPCGKGIVFLSCRGSFALGGCSVDAYDSIAYIFIFQRFVTRIFVIFKRFVAPIFVIFKRIT